MGSSAKPGLIILVCSLMGLIVAAIEQVAYDQEYLLNEYITEAAQLPGFQILTILFFMLVGGVLAALSSR
jgi:hypothetical protein